MNHAGTAVRRRYRSAIARAEAAAAADVQIGIDDLTRELAHAEKWKISDKADGSRTIEPHREMLESHLRRIEGARRG